MGPHLRFLLSTPVLRSRFALANGTAAAIAFACGAVLALPLVFETGPAHASTVTESDMNVAGCNDESGSTTVQAVSLTAVDGAAPAVLVEAVPAATAASPTGAKSDLPIRSFNGRPLRVARTMKMTVTAYSPDERSCGDSADGITASGYSVSTNGGHLVAADTALLPLGSLVSVPGYDFGSVVPVLDRGGAIKGHRLDVLFPTHAEARRWGVRTVDVTIWEYDDGKPNGFRERHWSKGVRLASRS